MMPKQTYNPRLPQIEINQNNVYKFLYLVLDRKQRNSIYSGNNALNKISNIHFICNSINDVYRYNSRRISDLRTIVSIRKLNIIAFAGTIAGRDIDGYMNETHVVQLQPEHYIHFIDVNMNQILSKNLLSNSFLRVLDNKLSNHIGLSYILSISNQRYFTERHDRNFHLRKDGCLSFLPKGRPSIVNDNGNWDTDGRMKIKFGKGLNKLFASAGLDKPLSDTELEKVVSAIKSEYVFNGKITEVFGDDIVKWYHYEKYANDQYTLSSSCMKHDECQPYVAFYAKNKNASMIIATNNDDELIGRAIVWEKATLLPHDKNYPELKVTFCDRAYGKNITVNAIVDYAKDKGYVTKQVQDYHSEYAFSLPNGENIQADMMINVATHEFYPYMDTFKSIESISNNEGILHNNCDHKDLTGTNGNSDVDYVETRHGESIREDDAHYSEYYDDWIDGARAVYDDHNHTYIEEDDSIELNDGCITHHDCAVQVTYPSNFQAYIHENNSSNGYTNGHNTLIDGSSSVSFDALANTYVYDEEIRTTIVTMDTEEIHYEFTISTALSTEDVTNLSLSELLAHNDVCITSDNTNDV